mgnify:CR=1 FL=1
MRRTGLQPFDSTSKVRRLAGWPAVEFDGRLLLSHQDALLVGGKVQAPPGWADHVVFLDPARATASSALLRSLKRQAISMITLTASEAGGLESDAPAVRDSEQVILIDEAAAKIKIEIDSKPEVMDKLDRRLIQLKIEREAVKKEKDEASKKRLEALLMKSEIAAAQALINSVTPPPVLTSFAQWTAGFDFPAGTAGADEDPDRDGLARTPQRVHRMSGHRAYPRKCERMTVNQGD